MKNNVTYLVIRCTHKSLNSACTTFGVKNTYRQKKLSKPCNNHYPQDLNLFLVYQDEHYRYCFYQDSITSKARITMGSIYNNRVERFFWCLSYHRVRTYLKSILRINFLSIASNFSCSVHVTGDVVGGDAVIVS
jgi:hypothetical protein